MYLGKSYWRFRDTNRILFKNREKLPQDDELCHPGEENLQDHFNIINLFSRDQFRDKCLDEDSEGN